VDSQAVERNRSELISWVDGRGRQEMRGLGASNLQGMLMAARYVHRRNLRYGNAGEESCRKHFTLLITDSWDHRGMNTCATTNNSVSSIRSTITGNRSRAFGAAASDTIVVGFGPHYLEAASRSDLDNLARRGGQAQHPTMPYVVNNRVGRAHYARTPEELDQVLETAVQTVFAGEYQGGRAEVTTLWTAPSDVGRVIDNGILVPIVQQPGNRGRLYAYRLFHEDAPFSGEWTFRGDPSLRWDAGALLAVRTSYADRSGLASNRKPRLVFTAVERREGSETVAGWGAGALQRDDLVWPVPSGKRMQWYRSFALRCALNAPREARCQTVPDLNENGRGSDDFDRRIAMARTIMKLRGAAIDTAQPEAKVGDEIVDQRHGFMDGNGIWKLGPLVHSSPATPRFGRNTALQESDRSYKAFAAAVGGNPPMAYVGAGHMIHAFFLNASSADGFAPRRVAHVAGEEAWAFLPRSNHPLMRDMLTADFASFRDEIPSLMDARCRALEAKLNFDHAADRGGWSALLICPSVDAKRVIALDVSEPLNPVPLWEFGDPLLGAVHSTPAVGRVDDGSGTPRPVMIVASGIGNRRARAGRGCPRPWCRDIPAVMVVDLASGRVIRSMALTHLSGEGVMTDVSAIDHDGDGLLDLAYVGTTAGRLLTLDLRARGQTEGRRWSFSERIGVDRGMSGLPQVGAPVIDLRSRGAARFNLVLTGARIREEGSDQRRGRMRLFTEERPARPGASGLVGGCDLMRARGARLAPTEYAVSPPVVAKGTALYTTVQGAPGCAGALQRLRCVDLDRCTETCNIVLCDPRYSTCSAEPPPPSFLADGRFYAYDAGSGMLKALARVTDNGVEVAGRGGLPAGNSPELQPNQARPKNLIMHWRESP
jgi:hypothetical protein